MAVHAPGCECDSYGCRLRRKGVQISAAATPTSHNRKPPAAHRYNQWEKGVAGEDRPGGTRMPYLDSSGDLIGVKPFSEGKHDRALERVHQQRRESHATST